MLGARLGIKHPGNSQAKFIAATFAYFADDSEIAEPVGAEPGDFMILIESASIIETGIDGWTFLDDGPSDLNVYSRVRGPAETPAIPMAPTAANRRAATWAVMRGAPSTPLISGGTSQGQYAIPSASAIGTLDVVGIMHRVEGGLAAKMAVEPGWTREFRDWGDSSLPRYGAAWWTRINPPSPTGATTFDAESLPSVGVHEAVRIVLA